MALKCAKNDFKHSTVHGDRRNRRTFGRIRRRILDRFSIFSSSTKKVSPQQSVPIGPYLGSK